MADAFLFCTGVVLVSLSGYLIEVTQSWSVVFALITLVNATGLGVFLIFGGARRVDLVEYSRIIEIWPRVIYDHYVFQNMLVFIYLFIYLLMNQVIHNTSHKNIYLYFCLAMFKVLLLDSCSTAFEWWAHVLSYRAVFFPPNFVCIRVENFTSIRQNNFSHSYQIIYYIILLLSSRFSVLESRASRGYVIICHNNLSGYLNFSERQLDSWAAFRL